MPTYLPDWTDKEIYWIGNPRYLGGAYRVVSCKKCGELHYLNDNNEVQVNEMIVKECINCAYKQKGIKLWNPLIENLLVSSE